VEGQNFEVFTDETRKKQDELIIAEMTDAMKTMIDPARVRAMGERLQAIKNGETAENPIAAVELTVKELDLRETEKDSILETFLRDGDYSQWGMAAAVTELANEDSTSYDRACELEDIGGKILAMNLRQWGTIAHAEKIAA